MRWDNGLSIYVFSEEIAIDADPDFCALGEDSRVEAERELV